MDSLRLTAKIIPITLSGTKTGTNPSHITTSPMATGAISPENPKTRSWSFNSSLKHTLTSLIHRNRNQHDIIKQTNTVESEAVEDTNPVEKNQENWMLRVLQVGSLWKTVDDDNSIQDLNQEDDDRESYDHDQVLIDHECDTCRVDDDDDDVEFDKNSFSELLWTVSLSEARLYAKMAYLGSLSYTIPKIKLGNLLKRHKLVFITSSLEKKATKEIKVQQDHLQNVDHSNSLSSSSPCEWYICDDDESKTRYFVIQGSESIASWQANLFFEPIQFEAMDAIVHRGIYEVAKVVYDVMLPYIHDHLQRHRNRATIRLTGHSLGGSLSLLVNLMLLIRGEVDICSLLPVITFGAPWVMCGGDRLLQNLGLPRNHLQGISMHRDIVPRAFSCNYPTRVAHLLKVVNGNFRNHPCLNNQNLLYAPMGELLILQPDAKLSPNHDLLPQGSGLYVLRSQASDPNVAKKQTRAAQSIFLNTPHPLEILTDRCAYGSEGAILRDHDVDAYLISIRKVISQELTRARRMRRQQRRQLWWHLVMVNGTHVKLMVDGGREWWRTVVTTQNMHLVVVVLVPFAIMWIIKACNWIKFRLCL